MEYRFKNITQIDTFFLISLFRTIGSEKFLSVFSEIESFNFFDFLDFASRVDLYVCFDENDIPVGMYWLDSYDGQSCRAHFLLIAPLRKSGIKVARYAIRHHLDNSFKTITCIIPTNNSKMIRFAKLLGFRFHEEMKGYYKDSSAIFGYLT